MSPNDFSFNSNRLLKAKTNKQEKNKRQKTATRFNISNYYN